MLIRLAHLCVRHRRRVLALWLVLLVAGFAAAPSLFGRLSSEVGTVEGTESDRAARLLSQASASGPEVYAVADGVALDDPGLRGEVDRAAAEITDLTGVAEVLTPWTGLDDGAAPHAEAVATDGRAVAVLVRFDQGEEGHAAIDLAVAALRAIDAPDVLVGGATLLDDEMDAQAASDLKQAELISMPAVLVLLLVLFGGVIAAGLPLVIAVVGIAATFGTLTVISLVSDVSVYSVNIVTMLGLGSPSTTPCWWSRDSGRSGHGWATSARRLPRRWQPRGAPSPSRR